MGVHMLKKEGAVFQTRAEAEEADHARYNEKQARIAERRRVNFEKKLVEGFKCHLEESCIEKFPSAADLADHIKLHKEQLRKRLICTNDTSRTSICGRKCISRREFNEHTEEHVAAFKAKTVSGIRSVLLYNKMGLLLGVFEKEYKAMMGKNVPYKALGFPSTYELLRSVPEAVEIQQLPDGTLLLVAVPDEKTEHMARMVGCQRYKQEGFDYLTGQVLASQSRDVKRKAEKVTSRRSREVPPFLKQQIVDMMNLEENRAGLDSLAFHHTYKEIYDYPLEFLSYGFVNLYDMLHHGLGSSLLLTLDQYGGLRIAPISEAPTVSEDFKEKVKQVLSSRPQGLDVSALPLVLTTLGEHLDHANLGFSDLEELCLSMTDICAFQPSTKSSGEARIMPISATTGHNPTEPKLLGGENSQQLPTSLLLAIKRVLSANEEGILEEELLDKYLKVTGTCLKLSNYGLCLKDLVAGLPSSLVDVREGKMVLRQKYFHPSFPTVEEAASVSHGWSEVLLVENNITWVRRAEWLDHLDILEEALERRYSKPGTSILPEHIVVNLCIVCLHPDRAVWCRGRVVSVRETEVDVWMLDYTGQIRMPFTSLRRLLPEFCKLPALAERMEMGSKQEGDWLKLGERHAMNNSSKAPPAELMRELKIRDMILAAIIKESDLGDIVSAKDPIL